jgi:hypothetical protein
MHRRHGPGRVAAAHFCTAAPQEPDVRVTPHPAIQHDTASRSRYAQLRERGHSHPRALRTVADRLLDVACAMLRDGTLFNPEAVRTLPSIS